MERNLGRAFICGLCSMLLFGVAFAQDPPPPPAFGVCEGLQSASPGLFGLCVAVCGAHDCEPDFAQMNPFANCTPADAGLIDIYNDLKQTGDPDMPCVPVGPCPCFTQEQIDNFPTPYQQCNIDVNIGGDIVTNIIVEQFDTGAQASIGDTTPPSCAFGEDGEFVFLSTSLQQALACRDSLIITIEANVAQCTLFQDNRP